MAVADVYYLAAWGPIQLWVAEIDTDNTRTIVVHEPSRGDTPVLQDRGLATRRARLRLLFEHDMPGETDSPIRRFRNFKAQVDDGKARLFTHPIDGSYRAKVGDFQYRIDSNAQTVEATCEFLPDEEVRPVTPAATLATGIAGDGAVDAAAAAVDTAIAAAGLETDVAELARAKIAAWSEVGDELSIRTVLADVAALSDRLGAEIEDLRLEEDLALFDVYRSMILLGESIRRAGIAATSLVASVFTLRVDKRIALVALMAQIYGGAEAEERAQQARNLNDIRTPGWLEVGQVLTLPQPAAAPRTA